MNLKKYRLFKFMALLMAFVWLFGAYATGMTGVHATDDIGYTGSVDNYYGGDDLGENDEGGLGVEAFGVEPRASWTPNLLRRDWPRIHPGGTPPYTQGPIWTNDNGGVSRDSVAIEPLPSTQGTFTLGDIHLHFRDCTTRRNCDNNSIVSPENEADRQAAFRVWNYNSSAANYFPYLLMTPGSAAQLNDFGNRWGNTNFQYAYVQYLQFDMNFFGTGGNLNEDYERMVIMGSFHDRMFVGPAPNIDGYHTLRNYLFPVSPNCPTPHQRCSELDLVGLNLSPSHTDVVHPYGLIFGGWFNTLEDANRLGSQIGRVWERCEVMRRVTTALNRQIYARWYPLPTVEKTVTPGQLTHAQVAAGTPLIYTITIDTHGLPSNMIDLLVEDTLDDRLTLVESSVRIHPAVGSVPNYTNEDGALSFYISDILGPVRGIDRIEITFRALVDPDVITPRTTQIIPISNTAILFGPPGPDGGREPIDEDDTTFDIIPPPPPPPEITPPVICECPECDCPECECVEVQQQPAKVTRPAGKAPSTGDFTATAPLLAGLLFSMSAVLGGTSLKKRFRR